MATPEHTSVDAYLASLAPDRREALEAVREVVLANLPDGFEEGMAYGMIGWYVPLSRFPDTYNGQPLGLAALASQKHYLSLYLNTVYGDPETERWFRDRWASTGKRLDMGKSCVRFRRLEDLPLDVIGETIARTPPRSLRRALPRRPGVVAGEPGTPGRRARLTSRSRRVRRARGLARDRFARIVTAIIPVPGGEPVLHQSRRLRAALASLSLVSASLVAAGPAAAAPPTGPLGHLQAPRRDLRGEPQLRQPLRAVGRRGRPAPRRARRRGRGAHDAGRPDRRPVHVPQAARRQPQHRLRGQRTAARDRADVPREHALEAGVVQPGDGDVPGRDHDDLHEPLPEHAVRDRPLHPGGRARPARGRTRSSASATGSGSAGSSPTASPRSASRAGARATSSTSSTRSSTSSTAAGRTAT